MQIAIVLSLLALGITLFVSEKWSVDVVTLLLLVGLMVTGILTPEEAFAGFGSDVVVVMAAIFVLCGAVQDSGVLNVVSSALVRVAGKSESRLRIIMMLGVGATAAFIHATTATALFINPAIGAARALKIGPSRLLMPLAFASMMGGTCTLIGTSTNIAVSAYMKKVGMEPFGLFEFSLVGVTVLIAGTIYMQLIGVPLLGQRADGAMAGPGTAIREYLSEVVISPGSPQDGKILRDSAVAKLGIRVIEILRESLRILPQASTRLQAGDVMVVAGERETLKAVIGIPGVEIKPDTEFATLKLQRDNVLLAEVLLAPGAPLISRTLKESRFFEMYHLAVLAIHRLSGVIREKLGEARLQVGDVLLVRGEKEQFDQLKNTPGFIFLEQFEATRRLTRNGWWSAGLFAAAIVVTTIGLLPISVAFLAAALGVIFVKAIRPERVYACIEWRLLILIGGMSAFGIAMEKSGAARLLAEGVVYVSHPIGLIGVLAAFCLLTIVLTQPMSNAAAALVVLPIALQTAAQLHVNPRVFALAVMLSASLSMLTPFEPSCLLVYGPGNYRFRDFVRVGGGLTLLLAIIVLLFVPWFYPLRIQE